MWFPLPILVFVIYDLIFLDHSLLRGSSISLIFKGYIFGFPDVYHCCLFLNIISTTFIYFLCTLHLMYSTFFFKYLRWYLNFRYFFFKYVFKATNTVHRLFKCISSIYGPCFCYHSAWNISIFTIYLNYYVILIILLIFLNLRGFF